jgi:hypothetical protein
VGARTDCDWLTQFAATVIVSRLFTIENPPCFS